MSTEGRELRESHGEGRGLLQFPVLLRTLGTSGTHRNSPPFGPGGKDGSLREEDDAPKIFDPQTWRQGGDRCERKWERPGKEKWKPKTWRARASSSCWSQPAPPRTQRNSDRSTRDCVSPRATCYPHLDRTLGLHLVFRAIKNERISGMPVLVPI